MSTVDPTRTRGASSQDAGYAEASDGYGWVLFAGTMLFLLAVLNAIDGIAAVSASAFFVANAEFVFGDLTTWGWVLIATGAIQACVALGVWMRIPSVRWLGVAIAGLNAIAQMLFLPAYPFWSLALFALDILVIYGLIAYGARPRASV